MPEKFCSLSQLLGQVKGVLEKGLPEHYWVIAEIMELHERRHCYLELIEKSEENDTLLARIRATIWASRYSMLRPFFESSTGTTLKSGIKILCKASVEFHPLYGLSLNISDIDPSYTLGDLARKKQEVIQRLRSEGVFDMNRELTFPLVPQRIAVISSESAAGYGDFMNSMEQNRHAFLFYCTLFPSVMQGEEAPGSIISALEQIYESESAFDCVVLIRGGGSKADLESFNNYELAYFITQFPLPVLTGIGHERDESVADMVAHHGLKTPTAVAEFLVDRLLAFQFSLSALLDRLSTLVNIRVQADLARLDRYQGDLVHLSKSLVQKHSENLHRTEQGLRRELTNLMHRNKDYLSLLKKRTELVDPENILRRGYSITLLKGKALRSVKDLKPGDILETRLQEGKILSKVENTSKHHDKSED
ncbi:MAG: exodeoxyribonuclease VII large subunit [Bacteroidales bacterium]|nr:exodeoxyribonuclease VII large subunit [Bacteroidales bacterium]